MESALWELLMAALREDDDMPLTCDQCFAILMYLAERATAGADPDRLRRAAQRHLARCPNCRGEHLELLHKLEVGRE